jgi:putative peptidoglycan lipid II flippase
MESTPAANRHSKTLIRGTGVVGGLTLISRLLGFIRDALVARLFGAGPYADAFFVAFRIPNLLRSFVAEGALTSAFVPTFAEELRAGVERARAAIRVVTGAILIVTASLTLGGIIFAPDLVTLIAPGFTTNPEKFELCVLLTRIMLPFIICISLVALMNGALNSLGIFGTAAWAQVWMNVALIGGAIVADVFVGPTAAIALAASVVVGGIVQVMTQVPALRRAGYTLRPSGPLLSPVTKSIAKLMVPALIGATVYQISIFLNTLLASLLAEGSIAWLFYADRLAQLPIGIFTIALASVVLPTLATAHAGGDRAVFSSSLVNSLRYTSFVIIPISAVLGILAEPIIKLLFERGEFSAEASRQTALAVQALALGLWGTSCHSMMTRALIAGKDTRTPTLIGMSSLIIGFILSVALMGRPVAASPGPIGEPILALRTQLEGVGFAASLGHVGLALASSLGATIAFVLTTLVVVKRIGSSGWGPFVLATVKAGAASGLMCATISALDVTRFSPPLGTALGVAVGVGVYLLSSFAIRTTELGETALLIKKIVRRGTRSD